MHILKTNPKTIKNNLPKVTINCEGAFQHKIIGNQKRNNDGIASS